jgi:hypothetical protein
MAEFTDEYLDTFLENQDRLFDEPVAGTREEAEAFLEDCMAETVDTLEDVREYLEELGMDVADMSDEELEDASEVFALPDGRYLIVDA